MRLNIEAIGVIVPVLYHIRNWRKESEKCHSEHKNTQSQQMGEIKSANKRWNAEELRGDWKENDQTGRVGYSTESEG
jgi:hypothetical protein